MRRVWRILKEAGWLAFAVAIVAGGVVGFRMLGELREEVAPAPVERIPPLVATTTLTPWEAPLPVRGEGFVTAFRQVALSAQTAGRIVELHPALDAAGRFEEGETLVRLDDRAARVALARTEAEIRATRARLDLTRTQLARGQALIERRVISQERLDALLSEKAELEATLDSLAAARDNAAVSLDHHIVRAPFAGRALRKEAELGAVVAAGQAVAQVYTDRALEVVLPLRQDEAALIPGLFDGRAAPARVEARFGGRRYAWDAHVSRVGAGLDMRTRTIDVTLRLDDAAPAPLDGAPPPAAGPPPALMNVFVHATIEGARPAGVYAAPSTALRADGEIWIYEDGALRMVGAEVVHVDGETTFFRPAAPVEGAALITSDLTAPTPGMRLRRAETAALVAAGGD